jgi:HK97 family phage major capsid protein
VYGLGQALEAAIITAAGPEPAMTGLLHVAGTTAVAAGDDVPETLMAAQVALSNLGYGDGLQAALNPADWASVALMKSSTDEYLFPTLPAAAAAPSLLGIGIITSPSVPAGTAIVANFRNAVTLLERESPVVDWGTIADGFAKNLLSARCEGRYAMTVPQPAAVAIADLTP